MGEIHPNLCLNGEDLSQLVSKDDNNQVLQIFYGTHGIKIKRRSVMGVIYLQQC